MLILRQTLTLIWKNILIVLIRHPVTTPIRAFVLSVVFAWFLSFAKTLFLPPSSYGIATAVPVRSLESALGIAGGGRNTVAFVNNGFGNGNIARVIDDVAENVRRAGKQVVISESEDSLLTTCKSTIRGVSTCFGAAVFYASPDEGPGGIWNYTLRADGGLGAKIDTTNNNNDVEIYILPLQHDIDFAIAKRNATIDQAALPAQVMEYPFTSQTEEERKEQIRTRYMGGIIDILAVAFFIAMIPVVYQFVGLMASERELGMTQMIEASMPNKQRWLPQMLRFMAYHVSFDLMFLPAWIVLSLIFARGIFTQTSTAAIVIYHLLSGLALSSFSLFGAAFFRKAQLSGIVTTISALLLAIVAQVAGKASSGAVAILSLLFPPMNYVYFTIFVARWERQNEPANLVKAAPENPWSLPGIVFYVLTIIQIFAFPILAALVERFLFGTASKGRKVVDGPVSDNTAVQLDHFTKRYAPSWWARNVSTLFGKKKETVVAVDDVSLTIPTGQIMVLLGANGSGKTTTMEAILGLTTVSSGNITVDGQGGLGICPQKNVLWDLLTVSEHIWIFNRLKTTGKPDSKAEIRTLIGDCDLNRKVNEKSRNLSGGQKRKLQLSMMFTGGSRVCCVDECSSGVDSLARQTLWKILMQERGKRTIIFTTHFLDEADLLSDQIAILSKGALKANGSAVELKHNLGGGYRLLVFKTPGKTLNVPRFQDVQMKETVDRFVYTFTDSSQTSECIRQLEARGITNYEIGSPSLEEIFFKVAEDLEQMYPDAIAREASTPSSLGDDKEKADLTSAPARPAAYQLQLQDGRQTGFFHQAWTLFRKRITVVQRNYLPSAAALLIPIIAAGLTTLFMKSFTLPGCRPQDQADSSDVDSLVTLPYKVQFPIAANIQPDFLRRINASLPTGYGQDPRRHGLNAPNLTQAIRSIDGGLSAFNAYIGDGRASVAPGGAFAGTGEAPTFAYRANNPGGGADIRLAPITQNLFNQLITNITISTQYSAFNVNWSPGTGKTLQLITYFGLAMCAAPAFLSLYVTLERLRNVRQLHYSNGVKSLTLWSAYVTFDFIWVFIASSLAIAIFYAANQTWYHYEYLWVVFFLYGLASILLSYVISLFSKSQLSAFAFAAGGQAVMFLLYFLAFMSVYTYSAFDKLDSNLLLAHFTIALITPAGNLVRALYVALNVFGTTCEGRETLPDYPGGLKLYGGPILYLTLQSLILFGVLIWYDSASIWARIRKQKTKSEDTEAELPTDSDVAQEIKRVATSDDGLKVQHITKAFGSNVAVQDVTFGIQRGEAFGLLGPNGAGKSTIMSLIRGDILPSRSSGEIIVEGYSLSKQRNNARTHLGVCPQIDAIDQMTVLEHLRFYARVRGVVNVENNVQETVRAVGLGPYQHRMAAKLSGGNKRKLSLAIALMGNPSVLLLDEPSSGMDVVAKRVMWRTLEFIKPGRSLLLTTHSMEEADALADRAGIIGGRVLAIGTSEGLRRKFGDIYHVHLIAKSAPHTADAEMQAIKQWVINTYPGAEVESRSFHGQLRFSVPANHGSSASSSHDDKDGVDEHGSSGIGSLFIALESQKEALGFEYFSVSQTTLDQVFLRIVSKHKLEEENYGSQQAQKKNILKRLLRKT